MLVIQCPNCYGVLTQNGIIWQCDDYHPEVLEQLTQKEQSQDDQTEDN